MESSQIILLLSLGLIIIALLDGIISLWKKSPVIVVLMSLALVAVLVYLFFTARKLRKDPEAKVEGDDQEPISDDSLESFELKETEEEELVKESYRNIALKEGHGEFQVETVDYNLFKDHYTDKSFLEKFTNSIKLNYRLKKKKYAQVFQDFKRDLEALQANGNRGPQGPRDENILTLTNTLQEIKRICNSIDETIGKITIDSTKARLSEALYDPEHGLDHLIGRKEIKDYLSVQLYTFAENPRIFMSNFQNLAIYAPPGYGKTKTAQTIGFVYAKSGILVKDNFMKTTKQHFTTPYVNESATKTRNVLLSTLESVLFIDEAYDLGPQKIFGGRGLDHGQEAITEMVNFLDKMMGLNVVIVAGYERDMEDRFMAANDGIPRRFPNVVRLLPYSSEELAILCIQQLRKSNPQLKITRNDKNYLYTLIDRLDQAHAFPAQGGDLLNLSADISNAYYTMLHHKSLRKAILMGCNQYLAKKNVHLEVDTSYASASDN